MLAEKVYQRYNGAHQIADGGGPGRSLNSPAQHLDEHIVQHNIGKTRRHRNLQIVLRLFRHHKEALEHGLHHVEGDGGKENSSISNGESQQLSGSTKTTGNNRTQGKASGGEQAAQHKGGVHNHGKVTVGHVLLSLAQGHGDDGAATRSQHKAHGAHPQHQGHDEVYRRKGGLSHKVGHKEAVHNAVGGGEQHHQDGGQHVPKQFPVGEVV